MTKRLLLAALPLLAACATGEATSTSLEGTTWAFTRIDGAAPVSAKASLKIEAGRIGANVGCNGMGGDLKISGTKLETGPIISTEMYCDGVMAQEQAVGQLLGASPSYKVSGNMLTLEGGGHKAELKRLN